MHPYDEIRFLHKDEDLVRGCGPNLLVSYHIFGFFVKDVNKSFGALGRWYT